MKYVIVFMFPALAWIAPFIAVADESQEAEIRPDHGDGSVRISGELKQWHKLTLTLNGPHAHERDDSPNPFTDYHMTVEFRHKSGSPIYRVPGYFAADGNSSETSARSGTAWRAHLSPDKTGEWSYSIIFRTGDRIIERTPESNQRLAPYDGISGSFRIAPTDKVGRDFRGKGRLQYVGKHHLRFAGSGEYFLKAGPDSPESLLAYVDFDGTEPGRKREARSGEAAPTQQLHQYLPHVDDWRPGDPTWKDGRGKGLIGAINYLSGKGCNTISFLPYNAGGDGDNVWPFVARGDKLHYDCSKLDQWSIVFDHATTRGLHLHFKLQENEIDDNRRGHEASVGLVPESLDGGELGIERRLYCRELIARYGHNLALNWNIGEENTQSATEQRDMIRYLHEMDPYHHPIVVHTFPDQQDKVYARLLGDQSRLTGVSLQNPWNIAHERTLKWIDASRATGRPWVVANDEQNPAGLGVPPDPGYHGHDGVAKERAASKAKAGGGYTLHDIRKQCLWGNLMAGGAGVEYYFGYQLPQNDLICEDFRSRDRSWDFCRIAIGFFSDNQIPFHDMVCADELIGNSRHANSRYCLAAVGSVYVVYLPTGGEVELDLRNQPLREYNVRWFNPRTGGELQTGTVSTIRSGAPISLGRPPNEVNEDWVVLVR
ncbi:MAG: DUF5060 domain-containing protein [Planctomycetales bacterium]|nr:DUF5060 domain-containing protein [Planctomycetales bacterium]